jgi:hypothetical protein
VARANDEYAVEFCNFSRAVYQQAGEGRGDIVAEEGALYSMLGASRSGKSNFLRLIALFDIRFQVVADPQ